MPYLSPLRRRLICGGFAAALSGGLAAPSWAHHSYSMFDRDKTVTIEGTIRTWEMTDPHSYLWVNVRNGDQAQAWGLEGGGVMALMRAGVKKSSVQPGEKVSVDLHPLRDGRTGGMLVKVTLQNGTVIRLGGAPAPGAPRGAE